VAPEGQQQPPSRTTRHAQAAPPENDRMTSSCSTHQPAAPQRRQMASNYRNLLGRTEALAFPITSLLHLHRRRSTHHLVQLIRRLLHLQYPPRNNTQYLWTRRFPHIRTSTLGLRLPMSAMSSIRPVRKHQSISFRTKVLKLTAAPRNHWTVPLTPRLRAACQNLSNRILQNWL
jgi:hypothetical protein